MKTNFYIDGNKVSRREAFSRIGSNQMNLYLEEAKECYKDDPLVAIDFYLGSRGMLTIEFE